jgi:hypothetical protein
MNNRERDNLIKSLERTSRKLYDLTVELTYEPKVDAKYVRTLVKIRNELERDIFAMKP